MVHISCVGFLYLSILICTCLQYLIQPGNVGYEPLTKVYVENITKIIVYWNLAYIL